MANKRILDPLHRLEGEQADASHPQAQVRLSASAGTGKTQVLTARVLRLLLHGVRPESILCLTFTKAGAAEMAERIHERLGAWVMMKGPLLAKDLQNLGEELGPDEQEEARNLFARVLDARGSGLRIQTIHAFCQTLLASFPAEAGLPPDFRPIEGREEEQLAAGALADMVQGFKREGRIRDLDRLRSVVMRLGEDAARSFMRRCAADPDAMEALPPGDGLYAYVRRSLTNGIDDIETILATVCDEGGYPREALERLRAMLANWRTKAGTPNAEGQKAAARIAAWLAATPEARRDLLDDLRCAWLTAAGGWRAKFPDDSDYTPVAEGLDSWIARLIELQSAARIAPAIADALHIGRDYAHAYADAKRAAGAVDFNDLIRSTVALLQRPGIGEWIRFKLDQSVDHILIDEAQDTNARQWEIVKALAGEFFAGAGTKGDRTRTIFKVGDFKQAIFGFQGTNPKEFEKAAAHFAREAEGAGQELLGLSLSKSFRSSQPILDMTDAVLGELGYDALGLPAPPDLHLSAGKGSGSVTLLPPVTNAVDGEEDGDDPEDWIAESELKWAKQLAVRVRKMTSGGLILRNRDRPCEPGDVMILVRSRGELARLIVSRLYEEGVPVAGVDRLRLNAPIAVQDLLACIRFALQPQDDLSLACLMVSPLGGWSQDELYERAKGRKGDLWAHLRARPGEEALALPYALLAMADLSTPYRFLEAILSGPIGGRRRLIARLGEEARDPIEELLSAALAFEKQALPSLQLFLDWFDRGEVDIKRDPGKAENAVRVMTVHGAKGLQAPVVILADATADPDFRRSSSLDWEVEADKVIPLFRPKKEELAGSLKSSAEAQDKRDDEEHWRLLYVAMTRAEEHLFIGGALKPKQQTAKGMGEKCWHVRIGRAMAGVASRDAEGVLSLTHEEKPKSRRNREDAIERWQGALPEWAMRPAPQEARPSRPLAPSAIVPADSEPSPPPDPAMRRAARRGAHIHALLQRLPPLPPETRAAAAARWLERSAGVGDADERAALIADSLAVLNHPDFAPLFAPDALAEAPLAGVVGEHVIAGTVDRLLVTESEVLVIDYKTGRRVPADADAVPAHHMAQMAAYAAVLSGIFPGRNVRAALLYTSGPTLMLLSSQTLEAHKPGYLSAQHNLGEGG